MLCAQAVVNVPEERARDWFLSLEAHPERYRFDTHDGFEFVEGGFGEVGARLRTRERFFGLTLALLFELTEVGESEFEFRLVRPEWLDVWGRVDIRAEGEELSRLSLKVGSETLFGRMMLRLFPVAGAVRRQIRGEVEHIKQSMERG